MNDPARIVPEEEECDLCIIGEGPIPWRDLKPGDLFSAVGPEYWDSGAWRDHASQGEKVYIRTEVSAELAPDGPDSLIYRIHIDVGEVASEAKAFLRAFLKQLGRLDRGAFAVDREPYWHWRVEETATYWPADLTGAQAQAHFLVELGMLRVGLRW